MLRVIKRIWHDPVWSKVIATLIASGIFAAIARLWSPSIWAFLFTTSPVPHWLAGLFCLIVICCVLIGLSVGRPQPDIKSISVDVAHDPAPGRTYPLKIYCVMRNDSARCVDVQISEYRPGVVTLKKFVTDVLQLKLRRWYPEDEGVDRVAVLPGHQFRAWVGVDHGKFNQDQVKQLVGQVGTLVLSVDGRRVDIAL